MDMEFMDKYKNKLFVLARESLTENVKNLLENAAKRGLMYIEMEYIYDLGETRNDVCFLFDSFNLNNIIYHFNLRMESGLK
jgi:hypothetical protein